jgi:glycine dehydrogenase
MPLSVTGGEKNMTHSAQSTDRFVDRHLGSRPDQVEDMLRLVGLESLADLEQAVVPEAIRRTEPLALTDGGSESNLLAELERISRLNVPARSYIGLGYHNTFMPPVIQRNLLENPGWYTQYTPYQPEIAQGRLEALMNFQTMICELTGLPVSNASLLDEATAAAEAMSVCWATLRRKRSRFHVDNGCHPQTIAVLRTRARPLGITVDVAPIDELAAEDTDLFAALVQYPTSDGAIVDYSDVAETVHAAGARLIVAADPLALALLRPPGEFGADLAVGSTQRFGLPMAAGGPHAAYLACRHELERKIPGRIVGVSRDAHGSPAYRLALQTREQHIRREKATSNICTAQVLPAILAAMYAVYHGPDGLARIARRVNALTLSLAAGLEELGIECEHAEVFDTLRLRLGEVLADRVMAEAASRAVNLRRIDDGTVGVTLDETVEPGDLDLLLGLFASAADRSLDRSAEELLATIESGFASPHQRTSRFLQQEVFDRFHTEHEMLRYLYRLQQKDLSLATSMIPLGSCTMKLNAAAEMIPITWPQLTAVHPFAPADQQRGYEQIYADLESWLGEITGLPAVSFQPNAGSQGEYTGLLVIRAYHEHRGEKGRDVCLIPTSAHGTNPASAVMAGLDVVPVACSESGDIDLADLRAKAEAHHDRLAGLMITYPSTHGVFEQQVVEVCDAVHAAGGQVYLDGANLNAQVGLCRPGDYGADVCHLNLHKTFCIPHGGGGPGMGPICVAEHLRPFLPGHPLTADSGSRSLGPVAAAPYGSPGILPISWMYIAMMGGEGLTKASLLAILNANYMAKRLAPHYPILYTGHNGWVAHEFIVDLRQFKTTAGIAVDDVAKRLMDFGFHAPTMSWPVAGTMMIEPTETESQDELDRFCDAMIAIRTEIRQIEQGDADRENNVLTNAPHTVAAVSASEWLHPYPREQAAFPAPWVAERKFWPAVGRIDNAYGDRHLVCTCDTVEAYAALQAND